MLLLKSTQWPAQLGTRCSAYSGLLFEAVVGRPDPMLISCSKPTLTVTSAKYNSWGLEVEQVECLLFRHSIHALSDNMKAAI